MTIEIYEPGLQSQSGRPPFSPLKAAKRHVDTVVVSVVALIILAPLVAILSFVGADTGGLWRHIVDTVLLDYLVNTFVLALGVTLSATVIGTGCAWLVTMCVFPGRRVFAWALVLPLAMPAYVLAYAYTDLLQTTGPVQTLLRTVTGWGWQDYWFPNIHSLGGAVFVLSATFYTYVYVLARASFVDQSVCALEVARTLGCTPRAVFWRVALPLARPAIATGAGFALMETLADFGAVKYFEVATFTTGIHRTWFAFGNPAGAAQLSVMLIAIVLGALMLERWSRGRRRYVHTSTKYRPLRPTRLRGWSATGAVVVCAVPVGFGFVLPAGVLATMGLDATHAIPLARLVELVGNSMWLGVLASALVTLTALVTTYAVRRDGRTYIRVFMRIAQFGYAVPGVVIAVGILIAIGTFDRIAGGATRSLLGFTAGLVLSGTIAAVLYGYLTRFFAIASSAVEAGFTRIRFSFDDAARTLGEDPLGVLRRIHLPLLRGSLSSAALLVFVEVMKELPATMILRPFNFDTLAIEAFQLATTERLDGAALPSLVIVAVGLLPVIALCLSVHRSRPGGPA